jgi:hypothetical protein
MTEEIKQQLTVNKLTIILVFLAGISVTGIISINRFNKLNDLNTFSKNIQCKEYPSGSTLCVTVNDEIICNQQFLSKTSVCLFNVNNAPESVPKDGFYSSIVCILLPLILSLFVILIKLNKI